MTLLSSYPLTPRGWAGSVIYFLHFFFFSPMSSPEFSHPPEASPSFTRTFPLRQDRFPAELSRDLQHYLSPDAADQLLFVLRSLVTEDFVNRCHDATAALGSALATRFGDEPSFLEECPGTEVFDAKTHDRLPKFRWSGNFHSVALLLNTSKEHPPFYILIDLTYSTVAGSDASKGHEALIVAGSGNRQSALQKLHNLYGGDWKIDFVFQDGVKRFIE